MAIKSLIRLFSMLGLISTMGLGLATSTINGSISIPFGFENPSLDTTINEPLYLPNGATVTRIRLYWQDANTYDDATLSLQQNTFNGGISIAQATASTWFDDNIVTSSSADLTLLVDNTQYAYWLKLTRTFDGPGQYIYIYGAVVEYTIPFYTAFLSLVRK